MLAQRLAVLPLSSPCTWAGLLPRPRGNVGLHRPARLGEGTDLAGVRALAPGDGRRRINWRTSLRSGELQVDATTTERDAEVVVLCGADGQAESNAVISGRSKNWAVARALG